MEEQGLRSASITSSKGDFRGVINRVAGELRSELIPAGDAAQLRRAHSRASVTQNLSAAFWRVAVRHLEPNNLLPELESPERPSAEARWNLILGVLAEMGKLHVPGRRLGIVLGEVEVAEMRVLRLLRARGEALKVALRGVVLLLASAGHSVDIADVAALLLSEGRPWGEHIRSQIGLDFYRIKMRSEGQKGGSNG